MILQPTKGSLLIVTQVNNHNDPLCHDGPQPGQALKLPAYSPVLISSSKTSLKPSPELRRSRRPSMNYNINVKRELKHIP